MALLEVRDASRAFSGVLAVDRVSLHVDEGETVSIIGPNGAGKTTLFNLITGYDQPTGGDIWLDGQSLSGLAADQFVQRGIARTFQHGRVFGNLSVEDNVLIGAHSRRQAARPRSTLAGVARELWQGLFAPPSVKREEAQLRQEVREILALFGERLLPRLHQPAYSLSYANRRRVEMARALIAHPRLLLLDEPTAGMNPTETGEVLEFVRTLKQRGLTILLIEHKLSLVMSLSDRVVVMDDGQKLVEGTPDAVRRDPRVIEAYLGHKHHDQELPRYRSEQLATSVPDLRSAIYPAGDAMNSLPAQPLLQLQQIDTFYGPAQVHFNLDIEVHEGEIACLLGGNASGKSTTMKVILGLVKPKAGRVLFGGQDITGWETPAIIRLGVGSVPESRRIFAQMTVRENLLMGAFQRNDRERVAEDYERMLALFPRLKERIRQRGGTLSGGEQQMLAIGRALMGRPRLICMDEPTMGLSPLYVDRVLALIQEINRQGYTIFMVEQNANLALQIADRGYVLQNGRIALEGSAASLLNNPEIQDAYLGEALAA